MASITVALTRFRSARADSSRSCGVIFFGSSAFSRQLISSLFILLWCAFAACLSCSYKSSGIFFTVKEGIRVGTPQMNSSIMVAKRFFVNICIAAVMCAVDAVPIDRTVRQYDGVFNGI